MPTSNKDLSSFPAVLHRAIDESHLSLAQIVSQISERGFKISRTTLSQWQTGASSPRRSSSLALISELEHILTLPPRSLTSLLRNEGNRHYAHNVSIHQPQSKTPRNNMGSITTYANQANEEHLHFLNQIINPECEVVRETMEEHLYISEDFLSIDQELSTLVRIPDTNNPTLHVTAWWTKDDIFPDEGDIGIYDIQGAHPTSTQIKQFGDGLAKITCLEFPSHAIVNTLHHVSYKIRFQSPKPFTETTERIISSKLRYYSCVVTFAGVAPHSAQWVLSHIDSENSTISHVTAVRDVKPHNNSLQVATENIEYTTSVLRWNMDKTLDVQLCNTRKNARMKAPSPPIHPPLFDENGEPPLSLRQDF